MITEHAHTILIVEDEILLRIALAEFLTGCGFEVCEAANADEAIIALERSDIDIDIVFTDVRMPGSMDGFGLARWVRENRPDLPVLIASGDVGKTNIAHDLCASEKFFPKPYSFDAVEAHIRESVGRQKSAL